MPSPPTTVSHLRRLACSRCDVFVDLKIAPTSTLPLHRCRATGRPAPFDRNTDRPKLNLPPDVPPAPPVGRPSKNRIVPSPYPERPQIGV